MSTAANTPTSPSTQSKRALLAERLRQAAEVRRQRPLSFAQQRLWFLDQLEPNSPLYNIAAVARLIGNLDASALEQALNAVIARHEALRTRFICPEENPVQEIAKELHLNLHQVDLRGSSETERAGQMKRLISEEMNRPFKLSQDPLVRATLLRLKSAEHVLILIIHHIVADEWSLKILFRELAAYYAGFRRGAPATLPELPIQYADYSVWQREWLQGPVLEQHLAFWRTQLGGNPPLTELPTDQPRRSLPSFRGAHQARALSRELTSGLQELANAQQSTLFMVLLAAFKTLLYRYTQQEDIVVGSPIAGRNRVETEALVGFFVNTLPLRTRLDGDLTFEQLLARVREGTLGAYAHQDLPFEKLVEELQPERSLDHMPFAKLMFVVQNSLLEEMQWDGLKVQFLEVESDTAKFDATLLVQETSRGLMLRVEYNRELFEAASIRRLLQHLEMVLKSVLVNPQQRLAEVPLLTEAERHQLLVEWNRTTTEYPRDRCIHQIFETQVEGNPQAVAVTFGPKAISYGELNARANQLAHYLRQFGIGPEQPVGICVDRSIDMVVGVLAILKAGGAYVPLDPSYPRERLEFMLEDTQTPVLLTQQSLLSRMPRHLAKVICLDADWELVARESRQNLPNVTRPESLAYVMYTSGSTGQPKGVAVPHRAVNRLLLSTDYVPLDASDRIAQVSNFSFDAATFEIWGALLNGGQLVGINKDVALSLKEFARELREQQITVLFLTTALFNQLASEVPGAFGSLRTLMFGGEAVDPKWVRAVLREQPPQRLLHVYGPTENTTFSTWHLVRSVPENATTVPVGRPIANTQVYLLDAQLQPVPIGVPGELYLGGEGLARGYWNRSELTAERFVRNPFSPTPPTQYLYKTGDLARYRANGDIEFLARLDHQVKLRGFRIELGEIEAILGQHPEVRECVVTVCNTGSQEKRLVAYFVPSSNCPPNASQLRAFVNAKLPDYMVPAVFVPLAGLPLTPNGKVDRKALPAPDQARPDLERKYASPRDAVERQLTRIWENVIGVHPIGIEDRFFDLGGHSLLAVRVVSQIEKAFGKKLRLATIFQAPTIERLAAILREEIKESSITAGTSLVEIQAHGSRPPLFLVHGAGGGMFWGYVNLSRHLGPNQPVYGFKSRGLDGEEEYGSIQEMAARYVADLRLLQPQGPYYLGGYCFGGNVAFEMARQLAEQGQPVALLALLNCAPPNSRYMRIPWNPLWAGRLLRNLLYWGNYFRHWSPTQRREFFRWKWSLLRKKIAHVGSGAHKGLSRLDAGDLVDLSSYSEEQRKVWAAHVHSLVEYHPEPFPGRVYLFRSPGHPLWCSFDPDYGWGDLAQSGVEITIVPGAHEKILEEPCVQVLARHLDQLLQEHQPAPAGAGQAPEPNPVEPESAGLEPIGRMMRLEAETQRQDLNYWKQQLAGAPTVLDLPADRPRPVHRTQAAARQRVELAPATAQALADLSQRAGANLFSAILAGFAALLQRYTGSTDFVVGVPFSNCPKEEPLQAGNGDNLLPLRCDLSNDPTFCELMTRLHQASSDAWTHARVPIDGMLEELQIERSASHAPLFQVVLDLQEELPAGPPSAEAASAPLEPVAGVDLALHLAKSPDGLSGWVEYSTDLFDDARMQRLAQHLRVLLEGAALHPDQRVSALPLLPPEEARQLLVEWNQTAREYPVEKTLIDLFTEQADRTPEAEALVCGQTRLNYRELSARAGQIARRLREVGVGNTALVGVCLERSWEMVAGILGTLQAGGAYVPLDPDYPASRLGFMLQDSGARVLLTQRKLLGTLPATQAHILCVEDIDWNGASPAKPQKPSTKATDLAYVIYTSGSTGQPKGVALEHRSAVAFVSWAKGVFTPEELSGVLASTSICFDVSVFELFVPLCWGGKIVLAENPLALPTLPAANEVKVVVTVPSAMRELLRIKGIPASVRVANLAGEPLTAALADQIYQQTAIQKVYDLFGPTETATYSTFALRKPGGPATIGRPLDNEQVFLLDSHRQPVPIGIPGELYIGGAGLAREYLNRPDLTAERFVPHPLEPGARLYKTGDLARWRSDGNLEFLGRIDHQVKIRGFRIELGEIETALKRHPAVREAVVVAHEDPSGDKRLLAYVVPHPGQNTAATDLRQGLKEKLPEYMVPSLFMFLEALPMTPSGKIDRKALPPPEPERQLAGAQFLAPRTPIEQQVAAIWSEVLQLKQVGVNDNFFDLGGHSLHAIQVISRVRDAFQVELPLFSLFDTPTVAALAQGLETGQWNQHRPSMLPLQAISREGLLPVSFVQERLWFIDQLEPDSHAYNVPAALRLKGSLDVASLQRAFNELMRRHEVLRTSFRYLEDELLQVIAPNVPLELEVTDLGNGPPENREERAQEWVTAQAQRPFDLAQGPLIRASLLRLADAEHFLVVVMHHTISDGWTLALLFQELEVFYNGFASGKGAPVLPPLPVQYVDFAHWQRHSMQGPVLEQELAYWKERLAGAPAQLDLPTDRTEPEEPTRKAGHQTVLLPERVTRRMSELTHREGDTPFIVLLTALALTLQKWTEQKDLVIGTVVAGRNRRELENVLGCFMNFLPIRTRIAGDESGQELLAQVRQTVLEAQSHQDCPFERIVEAINPKRKLNQNPLYNVALLLQNFPAELFHSPQLEAISMPVALQAALLDLRFEALTTPRGLAVNCEYKTDLFDSATIEQLLASFTQILERLVQEPGAKLSALNLTGALATQAQASRRRKEKQTVAVTATFTAEPLAEPLAYWLKELEVPATIEFAPYNQVFQQLLDPVSLLASNSRGLNLVLLRLEDWQQPGGGSAIDSEAHASIERNLQEFVLAMKAAAVRQPTPWLICLCPSSDNLARNPEKAEALAQLEESLSAELSRLPGVYVVTGSELARCYPVADYYEPSGDELGHIPYTPVFFTALATMVARKFHALKRPAYKVIVLDCDQTLWAGVCGEDGPQGIRLEPPWQGLQQFMRAQHEAGMLLCLCSKNNEADVRDVFAQRLDMPLRQEHFVAWRLNWEPKSQNLKSLAQELQLGLDSFIFLDDNPVECAEVEANCPEVLTLQLPENPEAIPQFLNHCWVFDHLKLTEEDRKRADLYRQNQQREHWRHQSFSLAEFLAGLDLAIDIAPMSAMQVPRVAQLTQRTNQFNFTTRRLAEADLEPLDGPFQVLTVSVRDRFGDYGLVGVIRYALKPGVLEVDSFLLSCRVLGRGVEHRMLAFLGGLAQRHHLHWVDAVFLRTARNQPALDFLESVGAEFKQARDGGLRFRFPAGFAAEVAFNPQAVQAETHPGSPSLAPSDGERAGVRGRLQGPASRFGAVSRFSRYRAIALECHDPVQIHARLQANTVVRAVSQEQYVAPRTEIERKLCELWQQLLHVQRVGVQDNFFALGGHSLLAVRLFAEIEKLTGRKLPMVTVFQAPTVEELARLLNQSKSSPSRSLLVPIQPQGSRPPLFLVHGAGGDVLWGYANLAAYLDPEQPIYGIKSRGQVGLEELDRLDQMAACYLQAVREFQPHGPYYLGGYCFGGNVAYEMARQLQAQGEAVALVALLDSAPSNAGYEQVSWWRPHFGFRFSRNLYYWLQDFASLKPQERRIFFLRKLRALGRKLKCRLRPRPTEPLVDLEDVIDPTQFPEHELKLWRIHLQALVEHVEQPYPGQVLLLRTRGQPLFCSLEEDFCWGKLVQGGVMLKRIPGSHENIFMEPNVSVLAQELAAALAQAQRCCPSPTPSLSP